MDSKPPTKNQASQSATAVVPAAFREFTETIATLAKASFETGFDAGSANHTPQASDDQHNASADVDDAIEDDTDEECEQTEIHNSAHTSTSAGNTEYNMRVIAAACANTRAMIEFSNTLLQARSLSEMVALSTAHARKQIETAAEQARELAEVAERMAPDSGVMDEPEL
jgi:hypothetical protein